jgi:hypothetical protein
MSFFAGVEFSFGKGEIGACSTSPILVTSVLGLISVKPLMQFPRKSFKVI